MMFMVIETAMIGTAKELTALSKTRPALLT